MSLFNRRVTHACTHGLLLLVLVAELWDVVLVCSTWTWTERYVVGSWLGVGPNGCDVILDFGVNVCPCGPLVELVALFDSSGKVDGSIPSRCKGVSFPAWRLQTLTDRFMPHTI